MPSLGIAIGLIWDLTPNAAGGGGGPPAGTIQAEDNTDLQNELGDYIEADP